MTFSALLIGNFAHFRVRLAFVMEVSKVELLPISMGILNSCDCSTVGYRIDHGSIAQLEM